MIFLSYSNSKRFLSTENKKLTQLSAQIFCQFLEVMRYVVRSIHLHAASNHEPELYTLWLKEERLKVK